MLRLLINPACSNVTQWLICIQMKYNVSRKTLFISVQSIHFFRLLNWEGIQLSYINNLQSSDIPKEFVALFCCIEIVSHFALMWFVSPGSDFPIMCQRLDSRNGLLKEGKRIYLTWIKIGSSSRVKLWITFNLQSRIAFHLEQLQLIVMPFISMVIRSQKGRVPNCQERLRTRAENSTFEIYSWHPSADCFDVKTAAFNLCDKTILTPESIFLFFSQTDLKRT